MEGRVSILISYDISEKHKDMKKELKALGYFDGWKDCNLPNTTLWKKEGTVDQANQDMQSTAKKIGVRLERAVAVSFSQWAGIQGDPHTS